MVSHFSANQYEDAFNSKKLKNWTIPRKHKEHPSTLEGFTQIIANDRGHLLRGIPKSEENPWGTFMGTWDMPCKIPPARPSYTARSQGAANNLRKVKKSSPLNNAVNGYKKFEKKIKTSPLPRPQAPVPPGSEEKLLEPSAGVVKFPQFLKKSPVPAESPYRKSVSPDVHESPCREPPRSSGSSRRSPKSPTRRQTPEMMKEASPRNSNPPSGRLSVASHHTV